MQQMLTGCASCDAPPGTETGKAHTWWQDERVTHPICVDCATQSNPDPDDRDHHACDSCVSSSMRLQPSHDSVSKSTT